MPTNGKSKKTEALITRWTPEQKREIEKQAKKLGISINELVERKVFDMGLEIHPTRMAAR